MTSASSASIIAKAGQNWEQQCFGCSQAESRAGIDDLVGKTFSRGAAVNMALGSILSDAQELMERGRLDEARQYLNRVKDAIFNAAPIELWTGERNPR